ncbi:response regulator [Vibrio vulnificus]
MRSIRTLFMLLFLAMGICSIAMLSVTQKVAELRTQSRDYQQDLHRFYRLSQELKQSSDHLTKFARAYVVTGDDDWEALFNKVLDIRDGKLPLPVGNEYEYWDLAASSAEYVPPFTSETGIPLLQRLRDSGISATEFLELKSALMLSDNLVNIEREAFLAVKGFKLEPDGKELYTGKPDLPYAQSLLYGKVYFEEKAKIMKAIGSAHQAIVHRIEGNIEQTDTQELQYQYVYRVLVAILLASIVVSFTLLWRLYISPLSKLLRTVVNQVKAQDYAFTITQTAYAELQKFIDSLNVVFHHISEQLSQNTLVKDFNIVLRTSQSTQSLCHEVTQFLLHQFPVQQVSIAIYRDDKLIRIAGAGYDDTISREISDQSSTQLSVLLSDKPYSMKSLQGKYTTHVNGGVLELNEIYYFPLCVNKQPVALLEIGTIDTLTPLQYQWLSQMLDDLSVSIQLSQNVELQRKAEQKVLEQSQLNQEILNATPNPMYCLSAQGKYLTVNAKFSELTGLAMHEIVGRTPIEVFSQQEASHHFTKVHQELSQEQCSKNYELSLLDSQGGCRDMLVCEASFNNSQGRVSGIVGILLDLTERKQMESELRDAKDTADAMSRAKGDFLANMSHEIRTPMNAILGMAHLALNTELDPSQRKYLTRINESAKNLLGIINDILDFSKIEAGKLSVESIDFSLDEVFENLTNVISFKAQEKGIEFLLDIDPRVPVGLVGDPLRLGQVLVNLCGNAVKFTEKGEILVSVMPESQSSDDVTLRFSVKDTGIGIDKEKIADLFNAFSQADTSITREFGGTGLGLSISKQLVELMGGQLSVSSAVGMGSTFTFTIHCGLQEAKMRDIAKPISGLAGKRALIVDDNDSARNILMTLLSAMQFDAKAVSNGFEALDELRQSTFDMVFVDWNMPGMNGLELLQTAHQERLLAETKNFLVTAYGREISMDENSSKLVDSLIVKPVNPSNLLDAIMDSYGIEHVTRSSTTATFEKPVFDGQTLLLVEDNEVNQEVAIGLLNGTNLNIITADNGKLAIEALEHHPIDLVLMDMQMPVMDGITATKAIRERAEWATLPIVAMTANAMQSDVERCHEAGMNDHVAKPINVHNLYQVLSQYLSASNVANAASHTSSSCSTSGSQSNPDRPASTDEDDLPTLSGINIKEAIFNTGGNKESYLSILSRFLEMQLEELPMFKEVVEKEDWDMAARMAHTLKGAAANLGVTPLAQLAVKMEKSIDHRSKTVIGELELAGVALDKLHAQLSEWQKRHVNVSEQECGEAAELYKRLVELVEQYDVAAVDVIKQAKDCDVWTDEQKQLLINAIESFEFEQAKEMLMAFPKPE